MMSEWEFCAGVWEGSIGKGLFSSFPSLSSSLSSPSFPLSSDQVVSIGALYDLATKGPCQEPKPTNELDVRRWTQWIQLGNLPNETARNRFVDELLTAILPKTDPKALLEAFEGTDEARERLKQRINAIQKFLKISVTKDSLNSSFIMMSEDTEAYEKVLGEKWSDEDSSGSENFGFEEVVPNESSQFGKSLYQSLNESQSPNLSKRHSSIPIHDHELQEESGHLPEIFHYAEEDAEELDESQKLTAIKNLHNHIEELARITNNTLTRLESLEKEISVLHRELASRSDHTNQIIWVLLSVAVPCCLFSFWALVRARAR